MPTLSHEKAAQDLQGSQIAEVATLARFCDSVGDLTFDTAVAWRYGVCTPNFRCAWTAYQAFIFIANIADQTDDADVPKFPPIIATTVTSS